MIDGEAVCHTPIRDPHRSPDIVAINSLDPSAGATSITLFYRYVEFYVSVVSA
jgi:hypothetical protein